MNFKIPIKAYVMDDSLSWEERYKQLEKHHTKETAILIKEIERLEDIEHSWEHYYWGALDM